jgi:hypothetical protein
MHRVTAIDANRILDDITQRQYLRPHTASGETLSASAAKLGFCPRAAEHAMRWLDIDPSRSIGRLRRTQLTQLANSIYRFWQHALALEMQQSST